MLLCIGPSNQEVRTLPAMMRGLDRRDARAPPRSARQPPALFLVLTKFDAEFEDKAGPGGVLRGALDDAAQRLAPRLLRQGRRWPHEWVPASRSATASGSATRTTAPKHMIDYDATASSRRCGRASERIERWKQDYLEEPRGPPPFPEPGACWDEALRTGDGGVTYLAEQLRPVCHPEIKRKQIETRIAELSRLMAERLRRYYVSGDMHAELLKRREQARAVSRFLAQSAADQTFGHLLKEMQVDQELLAEVFYRVEVEPEAGQRASEPAAPAPVGRRVDPGALLSEIFFDEPATSMLQLAETGPADQAERFANMALAEWMDVLRKFSENPEADAFFRMPSPSRANLVDELIDGAKRQDLKDAITARVRKATSFRQKLEEAVAKPVTIAHEVINSYVDYLGFDRAPLPGRGRPPDATSDRSSRRARRSASIRSSARIPPPTTRPSTSTGSPASCGSSRTMSATATARRSTSSRTTVSAASSRSSPPSRADRWPVRSGSSKTRRTRKAAMPSSR